MRNNYTKHGNVIRPKSFKKYNFGKIYINFIKGLLLCYIVVAFIELYMLK